MLALKKKREAEAKAKAEAAAADGVDGICAPETPVAATGESSSGAATNKVSLLGIGGKKKKSEGTANGGTNGTKKRTPGEIRIQKGQSDIPPEAVSRRFASDLVHETVGSR